MPTLTLNAPAPTKLAPAAPPTPTEQIIGLWLHGKSKNTATFYRRVAGMLLATTGKPLPAHTLDAFQNFADTLEDRGLALSSRRTYLSLSCQISYVVCS
jgi:hypothetical protein